PGRPAGSEHRRAVLGYLGADSISALPFRRLARADTARASQLFQHLLEKPGFSWERDGEALLRKHKPWCFGAEPQPPVTPLSSELAKALPSSPSSVQVACRSQTRLVPHRREARVAAVLEYLTTFALAGAVANPVRANI